MKGKEPCCRSKRGPCVGRYQLFLLATVTRQLSCIRYCGNELLSWQASCWRLFLIKSCKWTRKCTPKSFPNVEFYYFYFKWCCALGQNSKVMQWILNFDLLLSFTEQRLSKSDFPSINYIQGVNQALWKQLLTFLGHWWTTITELLLLWNKWIFVLIWKS